MKSIVDEDIERYASEQSLEVPALLQELRDLTYAEVEAPHMLVDRLEGGFLKLLVGLIGARRVLEIGMFTGYSALMMASAMADDGELITCDKDPTVEAIARRFFARSAHGHKIQVRMGDALETARAVEGPFDLIFLDADKENYPAYFDILVDKLRPGGLLVADNVLWSGRVIEADNQEQTTQGLRAFNDKVAADPRVEQVLLTVRDGMSLARRI